jgi:hypothetical protein
LKVSVANLKVSVCNLKVSVANSKKHLSETLFLVVEQSIPKRVFAVAAPFVLWSDAVFRIIYIACSVLLRDFFLDCFVPRRSLSIVARNEATRADSELRKRLSYGPAVAGGITKSVCFLTILNRAQYTSLFYGSCSVKLIAYICSGFFNILIIKQFYHEKEYLCIRIRHRLSYK